MLHLWDYIIVIQYHILYIFSFYINTINTKIPQKIFLTTHSTPHDIRTKRGELGYKGLIVIIIIIISSRFIIYITHITCLSTLICCPLAYISSLTQFYPPYLDQILRFWVTCGVNMMWLCHGWGWQPPQTDFHIYITHIQSVWAHWYAVLRHTVTVLNSYTHPTWLIFWGPSVSLVDSKWCDYVMVEADIHLKLLPTSILHI